jgi:hypothetical protein
MNEQNLTDTERQSLKVLISAFAQACAECYIDVDSPRLKNAYSLAISAAKELLLSARVAVKDGGGNPARILSERLRDMAAIYGLPSFSFYARSGRKFSPRESEIFNYITDEFERSCVECGIDWTTSVATPGYFLLLTAAIRIINLMRDSASSDARIRARSPLSRIDETRTDYFERVGLPFIDREHGTPPLRSKKDKKHDAQVGSSHSVYRRLEPQPDPPKRVSGRKR